MLKGCDGFGSSWEKSEKRFNFMWKLAIGFIIFVFIMIITIWSIAAFGIFKGVTEVKQHGLKKVIEEVWNGKESK
jgi:hypothetical protein